MPFFRRKKNKDKSNRDTSPDSKMPFFRHQSEKCRRHQEHQEMISQQDPEPRYDVSSCEMSQVPSHIYAECKGLLKEVLLLHDNWLSDLGPEDGISELERLKILDVHNNKIKHLPDDFGKLQTLQILDLSHNKLKHLPDSFARLGCLQTLKLKQNRFKTFPACLCRLKCLRTLDISDNEITELPVDLCRDKALDTLVMDVAILTFPPADICSQGTGSVMMYLCGQAGIDYEHPSKYWLRVCGETRRMSAPGSSSGYNLEELAKMESEMAEGVQAYQNALDQKRRDVVDLERAFQEEQEVQAQLAVRVAEQQKQFLSTMTKNDDEMSKGLDDFTHKREEERNEVIKSLIDDEKQFSSLVDNILDYNVKAKETEELLELAEQERQKEDDWVTVRWEEYQNVRKQEMLVAMQTLLSDFALIEKTQRDLEEEQEEIRRDALEQQTYDDEIMERVVELRHKEHEEVVQQLAKQEELQKVAFEALLVSRDATHYRIRNQISLVEAELSELTKRELDNREERKKEEVNALCDERIALSCLLSQLLEEKEKRKHELKKRLVEMEQQREDDTTDYWLVQYQRLMDWKPQALICKETNLEKAVKEILEASGASEYTPTFSRHRITIETLQTLSDADLASMGIHQIGLRRAILKNIDSMTGCAVPAKDKIKSLLREPSHTGMEQAQAEATAEPSAPPAPLPRCLLERQASITARGLNTECSICMERESSVIFLPCGHVCCCGQCSPAVKDCPLCRETIQARVKLSMSASA